MGCHSFNRNKVEKKIEAYANTAVCNKSNEDECEEEKKPQQKADAHFFFCIATSLHFCDRNVIFVVFIVVVVGNFVSFFVDLYVRCGLMQF